MSDLVPRAKEFAKLVHRNQTYGNKPYSFHLREVYLTLKNLELTQDEVLLASAWLHDSIEDTEVTYKVLELQFGKEVADLVQAVTNEKGTNRKEIFEKTALKISSFKDSLGIDNEKALLLKLADRVVNTEYSLSTNEKLYKMYKQEFPLFRKHLYDEKSISYPIIYLWYYLENLYRDEEDRLSTEELENIAKDIYSTNLYEREDEYYDKCYQIVEELMYDQ